MVLLVGCDSPHAGRLAALTRDWPPALALRRRAPLTCVMLIMVPWAVLQGLGRAVGDNLYSVFFVMLLCLYSAGRYGEGRRLVLAAGAIAVAADRRHGGRPVSRHGASTTCSARS